MDCCTLKDSKLAPMFRSDRLPPSSGSQTLIHYSPEPNWVILKMEEARPLETSESNCDAALFYKTRRLSVVSCSQNGVQKGQARSQGGQGLPACSPSPNQNLKKHEFCRHDNIEGFRRFTCHLKSSAEFGWRLIFCSLKKWNKNLEICRHSL